MRFDPHPLCELRSCILRRVRESRSSTRALNRLRYEVEMTMLHSNCAICGLPLVYSNDSLDVICAICGKPDSGHCVCEGGHYVCDECHRRAGVDLIVDRCLHSDCANPIELACEIMGADAIYANGPEHHSLVGAVLLCAYKNSGGEIELVEALDELRHRSMQIPGGTCGYWGCCGAAISAGQFHSIITDATPLSEDAWASGARLTSRILGRLADIGGPRCCKRTAFTAILEAADFISETMGISMETPEKVTCTFMSGNAQCKRHSCPYFPL